MIARMVDHRTCRFSRILEAGGGETVDLTSSYTENGTAAVKIKEDEFLTHVFVASDFNEKITQKPEANDIPHLRTDYVSAYLINVSKCYVLIT